MSGPREHLVLGPEGAGERACRRGGEERVVLAGEEQYRQLRRRGRRRTAEQQVAHEGAVLRPAALSDADTGGVPDLTPVARGRRSRRWRQGSPEQRRDEGTEPAEERPHLAAA